VVSLWFLWVSLGFSAISLGYRNHRETGEKPEKKHRETQRNPREEKPAPPLLIET
jgi:hypothetical protein